MRKLLLATALLVASGSALAMCPDKADRIVDRLKSHGVTAINVTYSSDMQGWAETLKKNIAAVDSAITVNLVSASGTGVCKVGKA